MSDEELALLVLLPPGPTTSLYDFPPVAQAQEEAAFHREQGAPAGSGSSSSKALVLSEATVAADDEAGSAPIEVLELLSNGPRVALSIPCQSQLPFLVLHLKDIGRFCSIEVEAADSAGTVHLLCASNKQASVRVTEEQLSMPLTLSKGWSMVRLNLPQLFERAWGLQYAATLSVTVLASCRVARIWLEAQPNEDAQLPLFLRTLR